MIAEKPQIRNVQENYWIQFLQNSVYKLSRGEICVANFIPPANIASQGNYFLVKSQKLALFEPKRVLQKQLWQPILQTFFSNSFWFWFDLLLMFSLIWSYFWICVLNKRLSHVNLFWFIVIISLTITHPYMFSKVVTVYFNTTYRGGLWSKRS